MKIIHEKETKKKNKDRKKTRDSDAKVKGCELNEFVVHLS